MCRWAIVARYQRSEFLRIKENSSWLNLPSQISLQGPLTWRAQITLRGEKRPTANFTAPIFFCWLHCKNHRFGINNFAGEEWGNGSAAEFPPRKIIWEGLLKNSLQNIHPSPQKNPLRALKFRPNAKTLSRPTDPEKMDTDSHSFVEILSDNFFKHMYRYFLSKYYIKIFSEFYTLLLKIKDIKIPSEIHIFASQKLEIQHQ